MKVTSELIARYHRNACTPAERAAVEAWLDDGSFHDTASESPESDAGEVMRKEIWSKLTRVIGYDQRSDDTQRPGASPRGFYFLRMALAASLLAIVVATVLIVYVSRQHDTLYTDHEEWSSVVTIDTAPGTRALMRDNQIDFCGLMRIVTTRDVEVTFNSTCPSDSAPATLTLRKGESYIAFHHKFARDGELLVVNSRSLDDLPPLLRRQFDIRF